MAWVYLIVAGFFEIGLALGLKYSEGFSRFWPTLGMAVSGGISFYLLSVAMRSLPVGTAYAVWTGIGAAGTAVVGMIWLGESRDLLKLVSLGMLIAGIVGLRLTSSH